MKLLKILPLLISISIFSQVPEVDLLIEAHNVSESQMTALAPESGCLAYNTDDNSLYVYDGTTWINHKSKGDETLLIDGSYTTITGSGTSADPYVVNSHKTTLTNNGDGTYTFDNGVDTPVTFNIGTTDAPEIDTTITDTNCVFFTNETKDYIITGDNFTSTSTVTITGQTVNSVTFVNQDKLIVNVTSSSTTGTSPVTVTTVGGSDTFTGLQVGTITQSGNIPTANMVITSGRTTYDGTTLTKTAGGNGWNAQGYSTTSIPANKRGSLEFTVPDSSVGNKMIGLNNDPSVDDDYNDIDYLIYATSSGLIRVYENGTAYYPSDGSYADGDVFKIEKDCNGNVTYYKNGNLFYTSSVTTTNQLYFDSSFHTNNGSITNIQLVY